jgi:hypothetical protein
MMRAALFLVLLCFTGCGSETRTDADTKREMVSESHTTTKEVTVHTPTADGGFIVEKTTTTDTTAGERSTIASREVARTAPDAATNTLIASGAKVAGAAVNAATGGAGGGLVETLIVAGVTLLMGTIGGAKHAQAKQLREERDTHKEDAREGWERYTHAMEGGKA